MHLKSARFVSAQLVLLLVFANLCAAVTVRSGTVFVVRLDDALSSHASKAGDAISGMVVQTVPSHQGIPMEVRFTGSVTAAERKGTRDSRALLDITFDSMAASGNASIPVSTRILSVDNARETVDMDGVIHGIRPMKARPSKIETILMLAGYFHPVSLASYGIGKFVFVKTRPRPRIAFPSGVEIRLMVDKAVEMPTLGVPLESPTLVGIDLETERVVAQQPLRATTPKAVLSDLTNIMIAGTAEQVAAAFAEAGWLSAVPLNFHSKAKMFIAMICRKPYADGPMAPLLLKDRAPDMVFQKQFNTFAKRHHIRLWEMPGTLNGAPVWVATATHDIRIRFAPWAHRIDHQIDSDLDAEREKVVADLQFLGRVASLNYVARPLAPQVLMNATGDHMVTDGQMAVIALR